MEGNMYYIIVNTHYNSSHTNPGVNHVLKREELPEDHPQFKERSDERVVFGTEKEALEVVNQLDSKVYYLKCGECARPDYIVVHKKNLWPSSDTTDASDALWAAELIDPSEEIKEVLGNELLEYFDHNEATSTYVATHEEEGKIYSLAYVVHNLSLERVDGELSDIEWENPSYFEEEA
jgi:hypothetical protein